MAMVARAPGRDDPPRLAAAGRRRRFGLSLAAASILVLAFVATATAGVLVAANLARGTEGIENPGQPLAGATMECLSPPEAAAYLGGHGYTVGRLADRDRRRVDEDRRRVRPAVVAAGPRLRDPGLGHRRDPPHGRRPATTGRRRWAPASGCRCREAHRRAERAGGGGRRPRLRPAASSRRTRTPSRRPSDRTTRVSCAVSWWSWATSPTPRTSPRTPTSGRSGPGPGSMATDVRAWLYTIGLRLAFNRLRSRRRLLAAIRRIEPRPWTDPARPGPVGGAGASRRPDAVGPPAQRRRRLQPARDRDHARGAGRDRRELAVPRRATLRRDLDPSDRA